MKFSDAVLLGTTVATPGEMGGGNLCVGFPHRGDTRCAVELALIAVGRPELHWEAARLVWPWLTTGRVVDKWDLEYLSGKLSLDAFVDWIRSVEPAEPAPAAEPVVAEAEAVRL